MENNEMINNVTEEVVTDAVENTVATTSTFAQKHPALYLTGAAALTTGAVVFAGYMAESICEFGSKICNKIRDKRNAKKAAKAKIVEGTDCIVEDA